MKLVALMVVRNEDWIFGLSARAALLWCDAVVILDHGSTDRTPRIIQDLVEVYPERVFTLPRVENVEVWDEMDHRQQTLEAGRLVGGTHFALVDADEVLTGNLVGGAPDQIRDRVKRLGPAEVLSLPMIPCWRSIWEWRDDQSVWSRAFIAVAFRDEPDRLWWAKDVSGYQHHHREPYGARGYAVPFVSTDKSRGGVMHLQFANWRRLRAKHAWYKMMEVVRWPNRDRREIDRMYSQALDESGLALTRCPHEWWAFLDGFSPPDLTSAPWHEAECRRLYEKHGPETFAGLELWGVPQGARSEE